MRDGVAALKLGPEFDAFLFASVDRDEGGMALSVVSVLARMDLDPWEEAAELTRMTKTAASQRLTSLIASLPETSSTRSLPGTTASRLVELLPRRDVTAIVTLRGASETSHVTAGKDSFGYSLILIAGLLCAQLVCASLMPPTKAAGAQAPISDTTDQPTAPPARGAKTIG